MKTDPIIVAIILTAVGLISRMFNLQLFTTRRQRRRNYYRNVYLKSEEWQRKRYLVLQRDHWKCVRCGARATQVHHKRYAKRNIGKEPVKWLVSVCERCHRNYHRRLF